MAMLNWSWIYKLSNRDRQLVIDYIKSDTCNHQKLIEACEFNDPINDTVNDNNDIDNDIDNDDYYVEGKNDNNVYEYILDSFERSILKEYDYNANDLHLSPLISNQSLVASPLPSTTHAPSHSTTPAPSPSTAHQTVARNVSVYPTMLKIAPLSTANPTTTTTTTNTTATAAPASNLSRLPTIVPLTRLHSRLPLQSKSLNSMGTCRPSGLSKKRK
jgi:hypothetical protein